jgi:pilus assembly protein Flp/PilA
MLQYLLTYLQAREEGQDLVEYALIIVLVALALVVALTALGGGIEGVFERITTALG